MRPFKLATTALPTICRHPEICRAGINVDGERLRWSSDVNGAIIEYVKGTGDLVPQR
jgi:hypothetical protein